MSDARYILCPYCGEKQPAASQCKSCAGRFDVWSMQATHNEMGCWFVRDTRRPHFVGFELAVLRQAIRSGEVSRDAVVRGPTTGQFWTLARRTPGIAHLFGRCYACQSPVTPEDLACSACHAATSVPAERNLFGLPPVQSVSIPANARSDFAAFVADSSVSGGMYVLRAARAERGAPTAAGPEVPPPAARSDATGAADTDSTSAAAAPRASDAPPPAEGAGPAKPKRPVHPFTAASGATAESTSKSPTANPPASVSTTPVLPQASSRPGSPASGGAHRDASGAAPAPAPELALSALSNIDRGLVARARRLESLNRFLFAATILGLLASLGVGFAYFALRQRFDADVAAARNEGAASVREEFRRREPVAAPKSTELPPMPVEPASGAVPPRTSADPAPSVGLARC